MFGRKRRTKKYDQESVPVQLRIMRTHVAAQAGEIGTLITLVTDVRQRQLDQAAAEDAWRERIERAVWSLRSRLDGLPVGIRQDTACGLPVCEHAPDGGNHPAVPA